MARGRGFEGVLGNRGKRSPAYLKKVKEIGLAKRWQFGDGVEVWTLDGNPAGLLERLDGPAVTVRHGASFAYAQVGHDSFVFGADVTDPFIFRVESGPAQLWLEKGKLERQGGPAIITGRDARLSIDGYRGVDCSTYEGPGRFWLRKGLLERPGGPAIELEGSKHWYSNGLRHRADGPAVLIGEGHGAIVFESILANEDVWDGPGEMYFQNGKLHRADGPAVDFPYLKRWCLEDKEHREGGPSMILNREDGSRREEWQVNDELHRLDGPAVKDGEYEGWHKSGKVHREGGPAVTYPDGSKKWFREGRLHRTDGPAIVDAEGNGSYFLEGKSIAKSDWERKIKEL